MEYPLYDSLEGRDVGPAEQCHQICELVEMFLQSCHHLLFSVLPKAVDTMKVLLCQAQVFIELVHNRD